VSITDFRVLLGLLFI